MRENFDQMVPYQQHKSWTDSVGTVTTQLGAGRAVEQVKDLVSESLKDREPAFRALWESTGRDAFGAVKPTKRHRSVKIH